MGGCGFRTIRFRPALIFTPELAVFLIEQLDEALAQLQV